MTARRVALAAAAMIVAIVAGPTASHAGDPGECTKRDPQGFCVEWDVGDDDSTDGDSGGGGGGGQTPTCYWVDIPPITDPTIYADFGLSYPPPGVAIQWQEYTCSDGTVQFNFRWIFDIPPTETANNIRARIEGSLAAPIIDASPPIGTASIISVPVFVAVANWTGVITESGCAGGICVTVTAAPTLTFDPGEPGPSTIACAGSGTVFNTAIPPAQQAAGVGACAHVYRQRTGVDARPAEWPGQVTVRWAISWTSSVGQSGVLPAVIRNVPVPRSVQEVQTVVVGGTSQ
jgi:hypothetical protein